MSDLQTDPDHAAVARLTAKERECLERWLGHATAKEIALDLGITHHAVEKRLKSARQKLDAASSLDAARILARVTGYGRAVSGSPEVATADAPAQFVGHAAARPGTPGLLRHAATVPGVIIMSLALAAALALSLGGNHAETEQTPAEPLRVTGQSIDVRFFKQGDELDEHIGSTFDRLDADGSGFIDGPEMAAMRIAVVKSASSDSYMILMLRPDRDSSADFPTVSLERADGDGDRRASAAEYRALVSGELDRMRPD